MKEKDRQKNKIKDVGLQALTNSSIVCKDCKKRMKEDFQVFRCEAFVEGKPKDVLFKKADCPQYVKE